MSTPDAIRAVLPILYATATSGGSTLALQDLPDSAELEATLNWLVPKFQSTILPHSYALSPSVPSMVPE